MKINWRGAIEQLTYGFISNTAPAAYRGSSSMAGAYSNTPNMMDAAGTMYSILRLTSQSLAQVDWHLYRKQIDGRRVYGPEDDNRRQVTQHLALKVLAQPNPLMHQQLFFERSQLLLDSDDGEVFWVVVKVGGLPMEIWPYAGTYMTEELDKKGNLIQWVYKKNTPDQVAFDPADVIQIQTPDARNMYRGSGPGRVLATEIASFHAAGEYNKNFFRNSAAPGGYYKTDHRMEDDEFRDFLSRQREQHQGVQNAHRAGLLENMEWIESNTTHRDMQFPELRNQSRELMRETYGIHKHMLGLSDDVNRANAIAAGIDFARWQLVPRLERFKAALNLRFLPMFGDTGKNVEFCYENPVPPDPEQENADRDSRVKAAVAIIAAGGDPEETMAAFGLPEITFKKPEPVPVVAPTPVPTEEPALEEAA